MTLNSDDLQFEPEEDLEFGPNEDLTFDAPEFADSQPKVVQRPEPNRELMDLAEKYYQQQKLLKKLE